MPPTCRHVTSNSCTQRRLHTACPLRTLLLTGAQHQSRQCHHRRYHQSSPWCTPPACMCRYHQYKFIVDGKWRHDETAPFMPDPLGNVNNWLFVRRIEQSPSQPSARCSCTAGRAMQRPCMHAPGVVMGEGIKQHTGVTCCPTGCVLATCPLTLDPPPLVPARSQQRHV